MSDFLSKEKTYGSQTLERGGSFFFFSCLILFLAVMSVWGGLYFLKQAQSKALAAMSEEVSSKKDGLSTGLLSQIFVLDRRLKNLRSLLSGHLTPSNVIVFLEKNTLPNVRFLNLLFDTDSGKLDMSAEAADFSTVARQVSVLERDPQVEKVEFGGLSSTGKNLAGFKLSIIFKKSFLLLR